MSTVILGSEPARGAQKPAKNVGAESLAPMFFAFGLVVTIVSLIDVSLAWFPLRFGSGEWEFGTSSATFNAMPLAATGLLFLSMAAALSRSAVALRVMSIISLLTALFLAGSIVLFGLNVPLALGAVPAEVASLLKRGILRTTAFAGLYIPLFGWLCWFTWRRAGAATKGMST
jgi:hypothetical protein